MIPPVVLLGLTQALFPVRSASPLGLQLSL